MWDNVEEIVLKVLGALGGLIVVANFFEKIFGIEKVGAKLYRVFPAFWHFIMRGSVERRDLKEKIDQLISTVEEVKKEVKYNGGESLKDIVKSLHHNVDTNIAMNKKLTGIVTLNSLRLDIIDEASHRMVFKLDRDGSCFFVNLAFLKEFGYTERDIEGYNWETIIHPEDREDVKRKWARAIDKKSMYVNKHRMLRNDGEPVMCKVVGYPLIEDGQLREFYGMVDEIVY